MNSEMPNLSIKIFSDLCCSNCQCESAAIPVTDAMGREKFWEDLGRPTGTDH